MTLVLADDLTGALEVGTSFARSGRDCGVYLNPGKLASEISVVNTNTRNQSPDQIKRIFEGLKPGLRQQQGFIYKKIDSTLRGPIRLELELLWQQGFRQFVIAPAYPALGRVTLDGYQYVGGQKISVSAAAQDPLSPATTDYIPDLLEGDMRRMCQVVTHVEPQQLLGSHVLVVDIQTDDTLRHLAHTLQASNYQGIIVGSNGLAQMLNHGTLVMPQHSLLRPASLFVVSGSKHPVSHQQLNHLTRVLGSSQAIWVLESPRETSDAQAVQRWLKEAFLQRLQTIRPGALLIIGGDTAYNLLNHLRVSLLRPVFDIAPGVPVSIMQGGLLDGVPVISKSGGFGEAQLLTQILKELELGETT